MGSHHFNPFENHRESNRIQEPPQWLSNRDFGINNLNELPRANNQITNVSSPDHEQIIPNVSLVDGGSIRDRVKTQIAQVWDGLDSLIDVPPYHDLYQDDSAGAETHHTLPPREVLSTKTRQGSAQRSRAQQPGAEQSGTTQQDAAQYDAPQHAAAQPYQPQYAGSASRGGSQGSDASNDGSNRANNTERTYAAENAQIKTVEPGDLTIAGPPTISAQTLDTVLTQYGSPVAGHGQEIFDKCVEGGIDPAIALAFFGCESTFGTDGIAVSTNSWGNIRSTDGSGIDGFKSYPNFMQGLDDWIGLMNDLYLAPDGFGVKTVDQALAKYAPPSENDTNGYIDKVGNFVSNWRAQEAERPDDETTKSQDVVDKAKDGISTMGGIAGDALQKMFFTQFKHPDWNSYDDAPDSSSNCGPASVAMALRVLGVQPSGVDLYGDPNPLVTQVRYLMTSSDEIPEGTGPSAGTNVGQAEIAAQRLGLNTEWLNGIDDINTALAAGEPVVLGGNPIAYNTGMTGDQYATHPDAYGNRVVFTGGHMISVVGRNDDGTYIVMDPAYKEGILTLNQDQVAGFMDGPGVAISKPANW